LKGKAVKPVVELLSHTPEPEKTVALAAKLCYSSSDIEGLREKIQAKDQGDFVNKIMGLGHFSVLEHVSFTFGVEGVSRALTHQLVRHRVASYSQKSQRYVSETEGFDFILPESIREDSGIAERFHNLMSEISDFYSEMVNKGIKAEDARYVLPNACETKIIITMNARELLHFFSLRCCERAQWEIRQMADLMLQKCYETAPLIFKNSGPGCLSGPCPEGEFACGKISEVRQKYSEMLDKYDRLN